MPQSPLRNSDVSGIEDRLRLFIADRPIARLLLQITLENTLERTKVMSPVVETALTNVKIAAETIVAMRAANLPRLSATTDYLALCLSI